MEEKIAKICDYWRSMREHVKPELEELKISMLKSQIKELSELLK
jgi:hypothetical protein